MSDAFRIAIALHRPQNRKGGIINVNHRHLLLFPRGIRRLYTKQAMLKIQCICCSGVELVIKAVYRYHVQRTCNECDDDNHSRSSHLSSLFGDVSEIRISLSVTYKKGDSNMIGNLTV